MGEADLKASNLAKSSATALRRAMVDGDVARAVILKVEAQLESFTLEEKRRWLECLEERGNVYLACKACGISRRAVNTAAERDALFADAWHEILEGRIDAVEDVLYDQCLNPSSANTIARIFYLKAARRDRYGEHVRVESSHRVNVVVELMPPREDPSALPEHARFTAGYDPAEVVDAEVL
jgi:hypothetical protein